ncbi:MAG: sulfatase, partial [Planctomycetota bacterium]|nr:sulfatase [Planctomycetota bacterium]
GTRVDAPIISPDFFETLLGAAGALPTNGSPARDGRNMAPLLNGTEPAPKPRTLGWHQPHQWGASGPGIEPYTAIRRGDWKLIWFHGQRDFELYDLANDLGERTDLAQELPGKVMEMALQMQDWLDERGAQLPIRIKTGKTILGPAAVAQGKH